MILNAVKIFSSKVVVLLLMVLAVDIFAQQFIHFHEVESAYENEDLDLRFELTDDFRINQAFLFIRTFGSSDFNSIEMEIVHSELKVTIPKNYVVFPYIEFYLKIVTRTGEVVYQPKGAPSPANLYRINVIKAQAKAEEMFEKVIVLSPTENEPVTVDDFFIIISLLRVSPSIDKKLTRVFVNDDDITKLLIFNDDLIFIPQGVYSNLLSGTNTLKILLYTGDKKLTSTISKNFQVVTLAKKEEIERTRLQVNSSFQSESNYEVMRTGNYRFNRALMNFRADYGIIKSGLYLYLTDEEKPSLQPQNRYQFYLDAKYLRIDVGDHYPVYPSLVMSGKRLRGLSVDLKFGTFNAQFSYGEINRKIEGELLQIFPRDIAVLGADIIEIDSTKYGQPIGKVILGTYKRKLFVTRPYFGRGKNFQLGFTFLRSRDELSSIEFGARPKENVVLGSDLFIGIDNQRIAFRAQGAFSIFNNDISTGNFTDSAIDSLFGPGKPLGGEPKVVKRIRDIGSKIITINQFIQPLNPQKLPTFAGEALFSLNYFGNHLKAGYVYRGNDYTSFGQNFLRNDIAGFQVSDRLSLFENRLFIGINYEKLNDNLQKTKITTTHFRNLESSISIYPRPNFPNITLGYANFIVRNDIDPLTADSIKRLSLLDDITHQISFSSNYDLKLKTLQRIFMNVVMSRKQDRTYKNLSVKYLSTNFSLQSFWKKNFHTFIGATLSISDLTTSKYEYYSLIFGARVSNYSGKLRSTFSINPSFGNLKRALFELLSQYYLFQNFSLNFNMRYIINTKNIKNESILNLLARYEI